MIPVHWWTRASTYIGILVVMSAGVSKKAAECLFPLTMSVSLYETLETILQADRLSFLEKVASIVGHNVLPLICMVHGMPQLRRVWVITHTITLLLVCFLYIYLKAWPYIIDIPLSVALIGVIHLILFVYSSENQAPRRFRKSD